MTTTAQPPLDGVQKGTIAELLRDVHLPDAPASLPPGLWFWVVLAIGTIILAMAGFLSFYMIKRYYMRLWQRQALKKLDRIAKIDNAHLLLRECRHLLRRVSITIQKPIDETLLQDIFDDRLFAKKPDFSEINKESVITATRKWVKRQSYA